MSDQITVRQPRQSCRNGMLDSVTRNTLAQAMAHDAAERAKHGNRASHRRALSKRYQAKQARKAGHC